MIIIKIIYALIICLQCHSLNNLIILIFKKKMIKLKTRNINILWIILNWRIYYLIILIIYSSNSNNLKDNNLLLELFKQAKTLRAKLLLKKAIEGDKKFKEWYEKGRKEKERLKEFKSIPSDDLNEFIRINGLLNIYELFACIGCGLLDILKLKEYWFKETTRLIYIVGERRRELLSEIISYVEKFGFHISGIQVTEDSRDKWTISRISIETQGPSRVPNSTLRRRILKVPSIIDFDIKILEENKQTKKVGSSPTPANPFVG